MPRAGRGLSAWALLLSIGAAQLPGCGGQSAGNPAAAGASSAAAGAGAGAAGSLNSAGSEAGAAPALCSWPAAFDAPDPASGQCKAARAYLSCVGSNGVTEDCLSDDLLACSDPSPDVNVPNAVCKSQCQPGEYALVCGGIGPEAPSSEPPPECKVALATPAGFAFFCCPCGGGEGSACAPLSAVTSAVQLTASEIVAAGRDADGTIYVLTEKDGSMRLFVSKGTVLAEQFETGTGEGSNGAQKFWTFQYQDQQAVTVEVQKDASGTHMGVAMGTIAGKGFDVGSTGAVLTLLDPAAAAAMPARTTQTFHVGYAGSAADGTNVVVLSPDHASSFDGYRVFLGPPSALEEQVVVSIVRGLSIPVNTTIELTVQGAAAELSYVGTTAQLTSATQSETFTGPSIAAAPAGAHFLCR